MSQTNYGFNMALGVPGGIYDLSPHHIVSETLDDGASVNPGMGLVRGATAGETVKLPVTASTAAEFEGVFVNGSKQLEHDTKGNVAAVGADTVGIMKSGRIWALIASTATVAYAGGVALITEGENAGKFTDASDASETKKVALTGVTFTGKIDKDNGIAVIEIKA